MTDKFIVWLLAHRDIPLWVLQDSGIMHEYLAEMGLRVKLDVLDKHVGYTSLENTTGPEFHGAWQMYEKVSVSAEQAARIMAAVKERQRLEGNDD